MLLGSYHSSVRCNKFSFPTHSLPHYSCPDYSAGRELEPWLNLSHSQKVIDNRGFGCTPGKGLSSTRSDKHVKLLPQCLLVWKLILALEPLKLLK